MTNEGSRILVATDLDDGTCEALLQAHACAESAGGLLGVCHISPERGSLDYPDDAEAVESCDERLRERIRAAVTSATGRAAGSFEVFVAHGTVYAEVVRLAESWRATLQRFSMTRNERGCLSFAKRVNGGDHDRAVLAGPS